MRKTAENIFRAGVVAVLPDKLIRSQLLVSGDVLTVCGDTYLLSTYRHIYVIGGGNGCFSRTHNYIIGNNRKALYAAGAVVDTETLLEAENKGATAEIYLQNADSYHFFSICGGHVVTGNTKTNVMDILIILYNY